MNRVRRMLSTKRSRGGGGGGGDDDEERQETAMVTTVKFEPSKTSPRIANDNSQSSNQSSSATERRLEALRGSGQAVGPGHWPNLLQRTRSRSVECMKHNPVQLRRSVLRSFRARVVELESANGSDSDASSTISNEPHSYRASKARSQSYYAFRSRNSGHGSSSNMGGLRQHGSRIGRCGSTPPAGRCGRPGSVSSIHRMSPGAQDDLVPLSALNLSNRLQSEESLILDLQRQQEKSSMNQSRIREETSILKNIKKRELIEMKKKESMVVVPPVKTDKSEERRKSVLAGPTDLKNIAMGLFNSRAILMAPTAAMLINPALVNQTQNNTKPSVSEKEKFTNWIPPPQAKPKERQLVRKVVGARLSLSSAPAVTPFRPSDFTGQCLEWHNHYREFHGSPPLKLDQQLCASSQYWANLLAHQDQFHYQNPPDVGENIFVWPIPVEAMEQTATAVPDITGKEVATFWYKTMRNYFFLKDPTVLHAYAAQFSQMVWASSARFGCGKARARSGKVIVVAHYFPKGNVEGLFHYNVHPAVDKFVGEDDDSFSSVG